MNKTKKIYCIIISVICLITSIDDVVSEINPIQIQPSNIEFVLITGTHESPYSVYNETGLKIGEFKINNYWYAVIAYIHFDISTIPTNVSELIFYSEIESNISEYNEYLLCDIVVFEGYKDINTSDDTYNPTDYAPSVAWIAIRNITTSIVLDLSEFLGNKNITVSIVTLRDAKYENYFIMKENPMLYYNSTTTNGNLTIIDTSGITDDETTAISSYGYIPLISLLFCSVLLLRSKKKKH